MIICVIIVVVVGLVYSCFILSGTISMQEDALEIQKKGSKIDDNLRKGS